MRRKAGQDMQVQIEWQGASSKKEFQEKGSRKACKNNKKCRDGKKKRKKRCRVPAHAAGAERRDNFVRTEFGPRREPRALRIIIVL